MKNTKAQLLYCHLKDHKCKADTCMAWVMTEGPATIFGKDNWTIAAFVKSVCAKPGVSDTVYKLCDLGIIKYKGSKYVPSYLHMSIQELNKVPWAALALGYPYSNSKPISYGYCSLLANE